MSLKSEFFLVPVLDLPLATSDTVIMWVAVFTEKVGGDPCFLTV
jgi:hypothetical protein